MSSAICLAIGVLDRHTCPSLVRRCTPTISSILHVPSTAVTTAWWSFRYLAQLWYHRTLRTCNSSAACNWAQERKTFFCFLLSGSSPRLTRSPSRQAPQHPEQHAIQVSAVSWFQHHACQSRQCRTLREGDEHEPFHPLRYLRLPEPVRKRQYVQGVMG